MVRLARTKHSFGGSNFHLQFTPKYRRLVFESADVQETLRNALMNKAKRMGIRIEAMEFGPDHIHIFITECKNYSASKLVGQFKGYSSYVTQAASVPAAASVVKSENLDFLSRFSLYTIFVGNAGSRSRTSCGAHTSGAVATFSSPWDG